MMPRGASKREMALGEASGGIRTRLAFVHIIRLDASFRVHLHAHEALELVYYVQGEGATRVGDHEHAFRENTFAVIPARVLHDQVNHSHAMSLCLGLYASGLEPLRGCWRDHGGDLRRLCEKLVVELEERRPGAPLVIQGLTAQVAGLVQRAVAEGQRKPPKERLVAKALGIIREQSGSISVRELSDQLFISQDYLRHLFKEYSSQSPMRHIIQARIDKACALLADTPIGVAEVADRCGFDSPYHFSRLFKKVTSETPSAYRKSRTEKGK
jgi:AraC-like DNA-binding protein